MNELDGGARTGLVNELDGGMECNNRIILTDELVGLVVHALG